MILDMDIYDKLSLVRQLVDHCEKTLDNGKLVVLTRDLELASRFIDDTVKIYLELVKVLPDINEYLQRREPGDKIMTYLNVYYRTLIYVDIPYIVMVLRDIQRILHQHGYIDKASEVENLIDKFNTVLSTLRH